MNIYYDLESLPVFDKTAVTTGTFDGVHLGHKTVLERLKAAAINIGGESVLLTFYPHPRMVLFPDDHQLKLLNSQSEKEELLEAQGINHLVVLPFTKEFSRTSSLEYARNIIANKLRAKKLVIGYDHHFGRNREGSLENLVEFGVLYGFEVEEIPPRDIDEIAVSSSKIRTALEQGRIDIANKFLGYHYQFSGKVTHGKQLGRTIGFPTANLIPLDPLKLLPQTGVYAVKVHIQGQWYRGMLNIGNRPTLADGLGQSIEVHIIDFEGDIYHETLHIAFYQSIRHEQKFEGVAQLQQQLKLDKLQVAAYFDSNDNQSL